MEVLPPRVCRIDGAGGFFLFANVSANEMPCTSTRFMLRLTLLAGLQKDKQLFTFGLGGKYRDRVYFPDRMEMP